MPRWHTLKRKRGDTLIKKKIMAMSCMEVKQNFSLTPTLIHKLIQILCLASSNPKARSSQLLEVMLLIFFV